MISTPILETTRLLLRPVEAADALWVQELFPQWEVVKYLRAAVPWPYPLDGAKDFIENVLLPGMQAGTTFAWAIVETSSGKPMGLLELTPQSENEHRGFWIAPEFHGKGYMTDAVIATTDFAFDILGMAEMRLGNATENTASGNLKIKAGAVMVDDTQTGDYVSGDLPRQIGG